MGCSPERVQLYRLALPSLTASSSSGPSYPWRWFPVHFPECFCQTFTFLTAAPPFLRHTHSPWITFSISVEKWRCFCWSHGLVDQALFLTFWKVCLYLPTSQALPHSLFCLPSLPASFSSTELSSQLISFLLPSWY